MRFFKRISLYFFMFFLLFFAASPALSAKAMATDTPSDLAIMVPKLVQINQHLPTLSFVTLRLGNYLDFISAEYLLGKAIDSSGLVQQGNLRIEQITFEHGIITTRDNQVWTIRVTGNQTNPNIEPDVGGVRIDDTESQIIKFYGEPIKTEQIFPRQKTLIYIKGRDYVKFDVSETTHKVIEFELGIL